MSDARAAVTIDQVAAAARVSIRTVSRVINNSPKVRERTRVTVLGVIEELGFQPNGRAQALASGRSSLIGVIQSDPNIHVIGLFQAGIVERCAREGFELVVHSCDFNKTELVADIETFVQRSRVDGLVLLPPLSERGDLASLLSSRKEQAIICVYDLRAPPAPKFVPIAAPLRRREWGVWLQFRPP